MIEIDVPQINPNEHLFSSVLVKLVFFGAFKFSLRFFFFLEFIAFERKQCETI